MVGSALKKRVDYVKIVEFIKFARRVSPNMAVQSAPGDISINL